jgi:osmotically-inducible protein OsmY
MRPFLEYSARKNVKTAPLDSASETAGPSLRNRVELFLGAASITELRRLEVSVQQDTVVLQGRVHTFYHKQLAQEFTKRVAGVRHVQNLIEVADER